MVISSSNRSPSPISMRPNPTPNTNPNPNSRNNQEREGVGVRKSFNGANSSINSQPRSFVPNTPVNSPAEYARRSSFGRECGVLLREHEQKENERDPNLKPVAKVRSPSISKGAKNFMSPTISAASKINPSPRKKVLGERNEAIRTSASLSEGKFHFFSTSSLEFADENESKAHMETPISDFNKVGNVECNTEPEKNVADMSPGIGKIKSEADLVVLSPEIPLNSAKSSEALPKSEMPKIVPDDNGVLNMENTTYPSPSMIAPLDADPSLPYDPKTNFLSPRPQFLHYKPNQRIETYISEGINLEDDFASESVSETENSEVQSEDSHNVQEDSPSLGTSFVEEKPPSSELSYSKSQQLEKIAEPEIEPRPGFGGKWKTLTLVLFILLGSISFSFYSPGVGNSIYHEKIISKINNNYHVDHLIVLFRNAKLWSVQSVGIMSQKFFRAREVEFIPLPFSNTTGWQEEEVEDYVVNGLEWRSLFERKDGLDTAMEKDAENEMPTDSEDVQHEIFVEETEFAEKLELCSDLPLTEQVIEENELEKLEDTLLEDSVIEGEDSAVMTEDMSFSYEPEILQEAFNNQKEYVQDESPRDFEVKVQLFSSSQQGPEVHHQVTNANEPISEASLLESEEKEEVESDLLLESEKKEEVESVLEGSVLEVTDRISQIFEATERSLAPSTAAFCLVVVSLLAATAFIFVKKPKQNTAAMPLADVAKEEPPYIPLATKYENISSWGSPVVVDMISESYPSEMSSFQKISSYNKRNTRDGEEAHSVEGNSKRNHKRESLASSSSEYTMCSSYGSFTTYSILHSKHRDDEVVTPVRRSSRIRSKVTSP